MRIWAIANGAFVDVTPRMPQVVSGDAASQWKGYLSLLRQVQHPPSQYETRADVEAQAEARLAAWAADLIALGRQAKERQVVLAAVASHHVPPAFPEKLAALLKAIGRT